MAQKKKLEVDWDITPFALNLKPALIRFRRYLNDIGLRKSTIDSYIIRVNKFLDFTQSDNPPVIDFDEFVIIFFLSISQEALSITTASLSNHKPGTKSVGRNRSTEDTRRFLSSK